MRLQLFLLSIILLISLPIIAQDSTSTTQDTSDVIDEIPIKSLEKIEMDVVTPDSTDNAKDEDEYDFNWRQIPMEDLEMTSYPNDEEADAIVLGQRTSARYERINNISSMVYRYYVRIKVLKESGIERTNIEIPFYHYNKFERITGISGYTSTLKDGEVIKTELKREDIFVEKETGAWSIAKIAFPAVEVGSVIEYSYELVSQSVVNIKDFYFQREIPVRYAELNFQVPDFFTYVILKQTPHKFVKEGTQSVNFFLSSNVVEYGGMNYKWTTEELPAVREESFLTTVDDYRQRVRIQLLSVEFPGQQKQTFFSTWEGAKQKLMDSKGFGRRFSKRSYIKKLIGACPAVNDDKLDDLARTKAIYTFVQQNMQWNGSYSIYVDESFDKLYKRKTGDVAEINLMLLALLKEAGIQAYPVLLSTRENGRPNIHHPVIKQFDYVILQAIIDGETVLMDAVDPLLPMGTVSQECLNQVGWSLKGVSGEWIDIEPNFYKDITQIFLEMSEDGSVTGYVKSIYDGYAAVISRDEYLSSDEDEYISDRIETDVVDFEIDSFSFKNEENIDKRFFETIHFSISEMADVGGDRIYFNPFLSEGWEENPFKMQERTYPVDLAYPLYEKLITTITLPEGYTIEEIPKNSKIKLLDGGGSFTFLCSQLASGQLQLLSFLDLKRPIYSSEEYQYIKQFFDMVVESHSTQIVLKKIEEEENGGK